MSEYDQEVAEIEEFLEKATDPKLAGPEWGVNMMICDIANSNHALCDEIVRGLQRKLQSGNPRVTLLTLILTEAVVKNGTPTSPIHTLVASRTFLNEVAALTDGSMGFDVQNKALQLIKQWADAFANSTLSSFQDTYRQLKIQGVNFPETEHDAPVFTPPTTSSSSSSSPPPAPMRSSQPKSQSQRGTREQQIAKLHRDLKVVMEKISDMRSLRATGQASNELEDTIDFLRQCQPRMNTLIEGGIAGKLDEQTLEECLNVNDHLIKALEESRCPLEKQPDLIKFDSPPRSKATARSPTSPTHLTSEFASMSLPASSPRRTGAASNSVLAMPTFGRSNEDKDDDVFV